MRYKNGDWYKGDFVDGVIDGQGVMRYKNGNKFTGKFQDGKLFEGEMKYEQDEESYIGQWVNDVQEG